MDRDIGEVYKLTFVPDRKTLQDLYCGWMSRRPYSRIFG